MEVNLIVSAPDKPQKTVPLRQDVVSGRGKSAQLRIVSSDVSREHCRLGLTDTGVSIRDLNSANGTILNGQEITPDTDVTIPPGGVIEIGPLRIQVQYEAASSDATVSAIETLAESQPVVLDSVAAQTAASATIDEETDVPAMESETAAGAPIVEEPPLADTRTTLAELPVSDAERSETPSEFSETASQSSSELPVTETEIPCVPEEDSDDSVFEGLEEADVESFASGDAVEPAAELAPDAEPSEEEAPKLKSLFGLFRRGKKKARSQDEEESVTESTSEVEAPDTVAAPPEGATAVEAAVEPAREPEEIEEETTTPVAAIEPPADADFSDGWNADGESVDEYTDDEAGYEEDEAAEDEPADPGFSDFLNQFDNDQ